jgi:hypothetical protein
MAARVEARLEAHRLGNLQGGRARVAPAGSGAGVAGQLGWRGRFWASSGEGGGCVDLVLRAAPRRKAEGPVDGRSGRRWDGVVEAGWPARSREAGGDGDGGRRGLSEVEDGR